MSFPKESRAYRRIRHIHEVKALMAIVDSIDATITVYLRPNNNILLNNEQLDRMINDLVYDAKGKLGDILIDLYNDDAI